MEPVKAKATRAENILKIHYQFYFGYKSTLHLLL